MKDKPEISVIVPALNEERYIHNVLTGLRHQTFKNFETIVVDNGSTDNTGKVAKKFGGVRVVVEMKRGISQARNAGARVAGGKVFVFIDADTKPTNHLLQCYHEAFKDPKVVAATGPVLPLEKVRKYMAVGYNVVSVLFVKASILVGRPSIIGINFAVRKGTFVKVGGFNEKLRTYEDYDLSLRIRKEGRIAYLDDALVYSSARRVRAWGMLGFFLYHTGNIVRYSLLRRPNEKYEPVR